MSKLQALGVLDSDLLHSISGREYVTPDHLCREIQELVVQNGGRMAVVRTSPFSYFRSIGLQ